jgi:diguanylate cyclase (GGDEF)-like protein
MVNAMDESASLPAFPRPKVLVVDDQALNIRLLHELLRADCDVYMATSGSQALELARSLMLDLILLDVVMPDVDGHEVCRRLKADPLTQAIPVIFITAQQEMADEVKGFELGAVDFITKPINPVTVKARVRTHIALKQQADMLKRIALVDGLTGIANRRRFDEAFTIFWRQSQRDQTPLSLILFDVDFFKRYNDRYGHQAGDQCLIAIANAAKSALHRPNDVIARYGGEEFACILPNTDSNGGASVASKILENICAQAIEHRDAPPRCIVTVSLGVATLRIFPEATPESLIKVADEQLYKAKVAGRSRFEAIAL